MDTIFKAQKVSQNELKSKLFNAEIKRKIIFSFITILLIILPVSCTNNVSPSPSVTPNVNPSINTNVSASPATQTKKVISIEISPLNTSFNINEEANIIGTVKYSDGTTSNKVIWFSLDSKIVTIDETGKLKTISPGKVKITVTSLEDVSVTATTEITVNDINVSIPTPVPSIFPTITPSPSPSGQIGITGDPAEMSTLKGKVYDSNRELVDGAKVNTKSIDPGVTWTSKNDITIGGAYVFRTVPVGARIQITVTKEGWTTRSRSEVLKSNLIGDPSVNIFDFSEIYAIQDEPEITSVKINTKELFVNSITLKPNQAELSESVANTTGLANDALTVEVTFSEPVNQLSFENNFRITSQLFTLMGNIGFIIDKTTPGVTFEWAIDRKSVTFRTNKAILANQDGTEARYMIDFGAPFKDDTEKESLTGKFIRFSAGIQGDFVVFSFANNPSNP